MTFWPKTYLLKDISWWIAIGIIIIILVDPLLNGFPMGILSWDTFGYYLYLPQTFIEGDIALHDQAHINEIYATYHPIEFKYQFHPLENGNYVIQYASGVAILVLPFFLIGHFFAWILGYPMDGFSLPYVWAYIAANYFYLILGILLFRVVLLHFFSTKIVAVVLILILLGTNFLAINIACPGLSHIFLFPLYCGVILLTIKWYQNHKLKHILGTATLIALIVLVRPIDGLIILFPLFYRVFNRESFQLRMLEIAKYYRQLLLALMLGFSICSIQLLYWKYVTGSFIFNSYCNPEEGLYLDDPNLFRFLFSYRNGWLVYTPIMFALIFGFIVNHKQKFRWILPVSIFTVLIIYMSACWSTWWYAHSFGQRTMMQTYPLLALPIGALAQWVSQQKWRIIAFVPLAIGFIAINIFQTYQFKKGVINGSRMTKEYYWANFLRMDPVPGSEKLLLVYHENLIFNPEIHQKYREFKQYPSFESILHLDPQQEYSEVLKFSFDESSDQYYAWYQIEVDLLVPQESDPSNIYVSARFFRKFRPYGTQYYQLQEHEQFEKNTWYHAKMMYLTPTIRKESDRFEVMIWNRSQEVYYKNLMVTTFVKK